MQLLMRRAMRSTRIAVANSEVETRGRPARRPVPLGYEPSRVVSVVVSFSLSFSIAKAHDSLLTVDDIGLSIFALKEDFPPAPRRLYALDFAGVSDIHLRGAHELAHDRSGGGRPAPQYNDLGAMNIHFSWTHRWTLDETQSVADSRLEVTPNVMSVRSSTCAVLS